MVFPLKLGVLAIGRALNFGLRNTRTTFLRNGFSPVSSTLPSNPALVSGLKEKLCRQFNTLVSNRSSLLDVGSSARGPLLSQPNRTHIKFSLTRGRQKTVKAVVRRFLRLRWGAWIHPMIGRKKRLWKKKWKLKQRLRRHVFCNSRTNKLFDHMVTRFWKRPMYYVDDPYEPYHVRSGYPYQFYTKRR